MATLPSTLLSEFRPRTTSEDWSISKQDGRFLRVVTANTARQVLGQEQARGSFPRDRKQYTTWVDNHPNRQPVQVRFGGRIEYIARQRLGEVYEWILQAIQKLAPIGPAHEKRGKEAFRHRHYYESVVMLVDGKAVIKEGGRGALVGRILTLDQTKYIGPNSKVQFVNIQPYARRIEQGHTEYRKRGKNLWRRQRDRDVAMARPSAWSIQAPNGVFKAVARAAARRFRGVAQIRFTYSQISSLGYAFTDLKSGKKINQFYPVIVVRSDRGAFEERPI